LFHVWHGSTQGDHHVGCQKSGCHASQRYKRHYRPWKRYEKPLPGHRVQTDVKRSSNDELREWEIFLQRPPTHGVSAARPYEDSSAHTDPGVNGHRHLHSRAPCHSPACACVAMTEPVNSSAMAS
jgi:hypothetical protein